MSPEHALNQFAAEHLGLALTDAFLEAGGTKSALRHLLDRGSWVRKTGRLVRSTAAPVTPQQEALAAVLDAGPGARLSHLAAAAHWGVPGFALLPADVLRPRMSQRRSLVLGISHWATLLDDRVATVFQGIPVVTPSYCALQLFGCVHPVRAERAAASMLSMRIASVRSMRECLDLMAQHGREGIVKFRRFVEQEEKHRRPTDSSLERRFEFVLRSNGERPMRRQVNVGGEEEWIGRIDQVDQDFPFVVEIDSERYHGALIDQEADERRTKRLEAEGYTVRRFTDEDCFHRPAWVAAEVRKVRLTLRRGVQPPDLATWLASVVRPRPR